MKKLIILFLTGTAFSYSIMAQQCVDYQMNDIYTPNGSPVTTWVMCEASTATRQAFDLQYAQSYPQAQQIKTYDNYSSTRKFNCHGYAWLRVEQGIDRWIGYSVTTEEDIYMSDGSYTQVSQETYPGKVSWGSGDHSAVTTDQSGWYISKWNQWPLMKHQWNYSPFGSNNLKYYIKTSSIISGPSAVCVASSGTFTAQNFPGTVTWTCSPNLILSVNGNTATVTNDDGGLFHFNSSVQPDDQPKAIPPALTLNSPPTGWIRAEVAGTSIVAEKTITTNVVGISSFVGLTVGLSLDGYSQASFRAQTSIPANVSWSVTPNTPLLLPPTMNAALILLVEHLILPVQPVLKLHTGPLIIQSSPIPLPTFSISRLMKMLLLQ